MSSTDVASVDGAGGGAESTGGVQTAGGGAGATSGAGAGAGSGAGAGAATAGASGGGAGGGATGGGAAFVCAMAAWDIEHSNDTATSDIGSFFTLAASLWPRTLLDLCDG
jgi:hypothetical protein